jgi:hypothetical protein
MYTLVGGDLSNEKPHPDLGVQLDPRPKRLEPHTADSSTGM